MPVTASTLYFWTSAKQPKNLPNFSCAIIGAQLCCVKLKYHFCFSLLICTNLCKRFVLLFYLSQIKLFAQRISKYTNLMKFDHLSHFI